MIDMVNENMKELREYKRKYENNQGRVRIEEELGMTNREYQLIADSVMSLMLKGQH